MIWRKLSWRYRGIIPEFSRRTEENYETFFQSSRCLNWYLKQRSLWIQVYKVTTMPTCLVTFLVAGNLMRKVRTDLTSTIRVQCIRFVQSTHMCTDRKCYRKWQASSCRNGMNPRQFGVESEVLWLYRVGPDMLNNLMWTVDTGWSFILEIRRD